MQATDLLGRDAQHQPGSRVLRSNLHGDHALVRANGHSRQHAGCSPHTHTSRRLPLLQPAHEPRQQSHGSHKKDDYEQRLGHVSAIHG